MVRRNNFVAMHHVECYEPAAASTPLEGSVMTEASVKTKKSAFDMPTFDMPNFEMPKMEVPAAFRELAEKSVSQAKDNWEKMKAVTEDATDMIESSYSTATKGASDYGLAMIEAARANTNATFDFYGRLMTAKSLSEMIELSTAHARKQFETATAQSKDLTALAQKVAAESMEPIKSGMTSAFKKAA
jgi:phasin